MDVKDFIHLSREMAEVVKQNNLQELIFAFGDVKLSMTAKPDNVVVSDTTIIETALPAAAPAPKAVKGEVMKAPIIGTFYAAPSPDSEPFVKVGSVVEKGQVVCIIESMKLMNDVLAEYSGTVKEICVKNGDSVEFDQPLMIIE